MTANEGLKEDRRGGSAPIVLELEPSETFVYRSTTVLAASDLRSAGSSLPRDGATAFGDEFHADHVVLARETQIVSGSEGYGRRRCGVAVDGLDDIAAGSDRLEIVKAAKACCEGRNLRPLNW